MPLEQTLWELRERAGLSQEELAQRLGVSRQAVSKWETGQSVPDVERLVALSRLYAVSVDGLLGLAPMESTAKRPVFQCGGVLLAVGMSAAWGLVFLCAVGGVGPFSMGDADALALPASTLSLLGIPAFEAGRVRGERMLPRHTFYRRMIWAMALPPARLCAVWCMALLGRFLWEWSMAGPVCLFLETGLWAGLYAAVCVGIHRLWKTENAGLLPRAGTGPRRGAGARACQPNDGGKGETK